MNPHPEALYVYPCLPEGPVEDAVMCPNWASALAAARHVSDKYGGLNIHADEEDLSGDLGLIVLISATDPMLVRADTGLALENPKFLDRFIRDLVIKLLGSAEYDAMMDDAHHQIRAFVYDGYHVRGLNNLTDQELVDEWNTTGMFEDPEYPTITAELLTHYRCGVCRKKGVHWAEHCPASTLPGQFQESILFGC
jgi:hypothetical protein